MHDHTQRRRRKRILFKHTLHVELWFCASPGNLNYSYWSTLLNYEVVLVNGITVYPECINKGSCLPEWILVHHQDQKLGHISCSVFLTFVLNYHQRALIKIRNRATYLFHMHLQISELYIKTIYDICMWFSQRKKSINASGCICLRNRWKNTVFAVLLKHRNIIILKATKTR